MSLRPLGAVRPPARALSEVPDLAFGAAVAPAPPLAALLLVGSVGQQRRICLLRATLARAIAGTLLVFLQVPMGGGRTDPVRRHVSRIGVGLLV